MFISLNFFEIFIYLIDDDQKNKRQIQKVNNFEPNDKQYILYTYKYLTNKFRLKNREKRRDISSY